MGSYRRGMSIRDRIWLVVLILCLIGVIVAAYSVMRREEGVRLHSAITYGSLEEVRDIVDDGVDIDFLHNDKTPLLAAALEGYGEIVDFLLEAGADPALAGPDGVSLLDWSAAWAPAKTFFRFFGEKYELNPNEVVWGNSVLVGRLLLRRSGIDEGDRDAVRYLVERGADPNSVDTGLDRSCVHLAVLYWEPEIVRLLCEAGADVNVPDYRTRFPMHFAVFHGVDTVKVLLEFGAELDVVDGRARTPLDYVKLEVDSQLDPAWEYPVDYKYLDSLKEVIEYLESLSTTE